MNQDERCPICEGTFERGYSTTPDLDDPACTERVKICLDCSRYTEVWAPRGCERCGFLRQRVKVTRYLQGFRDGLPLYTERHYSRYCEPCRLDLSARSHEQSAFRFRQQAAELRAKRGL